MRTINTEYLKSLNPCQNRLDNWVEQYPEWEGSLKQFINLKKITHQDKLWVFFRSIDKKDIQLVAADFAEEVLHIFESKYPNDLRPRKAIEAARLGNATSAANAADAAADAAYAAADAADAAAYAAANAAANAASAAAYATTNSMNHVMEKHQIKIMKKYLKGKGDNK